MIPVFQKVFGQVMARPFGGAESTPPIITATVTPVAEDLFEGDTVGDITNIATWRNTSNYSSTAGTISTAVIEVDGTPQLNAFVLSEFEFVRVAVTDSVANIRYWTIDASVDAGITINNVVVGANNVVVGANNVVVTA